MGIAKATVSHHKTISLIQNKERRTHYSLSDYVGTLVVTI